MSIYAAIPGYRNVTKKEAEKHVECESNSDTGNNRGTGPISISLRKYLSNKQRKREIKELQKTIILGTAHILCKAATNVKAQNIFHGRNNITCGKNCK
jgi:hypothetical protein